MTSDTIAVSNSISARWLRWARLVWIPTFFATLVIFILTISGFFPIRLDPHFSVNSSQVIQPLTWVVGGAATVTAMLSLLLALLLFRRRSHDSMALFVSFYLLGFTIVSLPLQVLDPILPFDIIVFGWVVLFPLVMYPASCFLFLLFPDGRFSPDWARWIALAILISAPGMAVAFLISFRSNSPNLGSSIGSVMLLVGLASALYTQFYRYRHIASQQQRRQIKWLVYGWGIMLFMGVFSSIPYIWPLTLPKVIPEPILSATTLIGYLLYHAVLPVSLTIAIMRHQLYDIDFLINRTLVYSALTVIIIGIYILVVGALGTFFQAQGNLLIALIATGLVAVLFQPLRARLQRAVNRLIFGERDEPFEALSRLANRLESALDPSAVLPTLVETIAKTLKLPYTAILLSEEAGDRVAAEHGRPSSHAIKLPLTYQGKEFGWLVVAPSYPGESFQHSEMRLLENIARQAGAAVHAVQLTQDLQRSRQRLVTAREEERRRLRRDLHDGIGPTLAALHVQASALRRLIQHNPEAAEKMVTEFDDEIRGAIDDIRRVVYELRPPTLDEFGLVGATRAYAAHCDRQIYQQFDQESDQHSDNGALSIHVEAPAELPQLSAAVEVAAYQVVREALTNVVYHAQARRCQVRFRVEDALVIEIADDGRGIGKENHIGVGLLSMRERTEELGGVFSISPERDGGTRVTAQFPFLEA
jgi:signal transduction histidine kinase